MQEAAIETLFAGEPWVGFDRFMGFALLDPDHGFYSQAHPVLGDQGHFVTAPLLGDWLARLVTQEALDLAVQLRLLQRDFTIREYGPGNGRLAADLLFGMGRQGGGPDRYEFIEESAARQAEQAQALAGRFGSQPSQPSFVTELAWPKTTGPLSGLILANEFLDALPVQVFEWQPDHPDGPVLEWGLGLQTEATAPVLGSRLQASTPPAGRLQWQTRAARADLREQVMARAQAARERGLGWRHGHRGEWCPELQPWVKRVSQDLQAGEVLVLDYGYEDYELDHPDRPSGTLAGHSGHRRIDDWHALIERPGSIDLTAHVNFTQLAQAFLDEGFEVGLQTQAAWMLDRGVLDQARDLLFEGVGHDPGAPPSNRDALAQLAQLQILLGDSAMGQSFMVLSAKRF